MASFYPSDPNDQHRTQSELRDWEARQKEKKARDKKETVRFWITTILAFIAAAAAVAGVLIQLFLK